MSARSIAFIGIPHFPIAVERVVNRRLRGRPVVMASSDSQRSRCLAVSPEARAWGIRSGMPLFTARRLCRDLVNLSPNDSLQARASTAIQKALADYTPLCEMSRLGQAYLDLSGSGRLFGGALPAVRMIRERIILELRLPADAGLAVNKLVSRVAAIDADPEGLMEVQSGREEPFLAPHSVNVLPSVDQKLMTTLRELNIMLIRQIREIEFEALAAALGAGAAMLARQARGIDHAPVLPPSAPPCVVSTEELAEDTNDGDVIEAVARSLALEATFKLQRTRRAARRLVVRLAYSDGRTTAGSSALRQPTSSSRLWIREASEVLERIRSRRVRVHRVELTFWELVACGEQMDLWEHPLTGAAAASSSEASFAPDRMGKALQALSAVQERFGERALRLGAKN